VRALEAKNQSLTPVLALEMGALSAQTAPSMDKAPKKARVVRVSKGPNEPPKPCKPRGPRKAKDGFGELERVKSPQGKRVPKVRAARPLRQGRGRGKGKQPLNDLTVHEGVLPVFQRPTIELNEVFPAKTRCKTASRPATRSNKFMVMTTAFRGGQTTLMIRRKCGPKRRWQNSCKRSVQLYRQTWVAQRVELKFSLSHLLVGLPLLMLQKKLQRILLKSGRKTTRPF
jgi:hypothetical protein